MMFRKAKVRQSAKNSDDPLHTSKAGRALIPVLVMVMLVAVALPSASEAESAQHQVAPPIALVAKAPVARLLGPPRAVNAIGAASLAIAVQGANVKKVWEAQHLIDLKKQAAQSQNRSHSSAPVYSDSNPGAFLSCVRGIESSGQYDVVSSNGLWHGGYQFTQGTWNSAAIHMRRLDLVGVPPETAAPTDQDQLAQGLYAWQGTGPWAGDVAKCS